MGCSPTAVPIWLRNRLWALLAKAPLLAAKGEAPLWPKAIMLPYGRTKPLFLWVLLKDVLLMLLKPLLQNYVFKQQRHFGPHP